MSSYSDFLTQEEINRLLGFGSDTQADEDKEAECESKYRKAIEALEEIIKDLEIEDSFYDKYDDPEEFVAVIKNVLNSSHEDKEDKAKESEILTLDERIMQAKKKCHLL